MHPTNPSTLLHLLLLITILSFLHPTSAVLERGIAYLNEYDPDSTESHEWHKRMNGVGVIEVKAERAAPPAVKRADYDWSVAAEGDGGVGKDGNDWGKRDDIMRNVATGDVEDETEKESGWNHKRMERANVAGQGGANSAGQGAYVEPDNAQEGSEWGKRGESGTCAACVRRGTNWDGAPTEDGPKRYYQGKTPPAGDNDGNEWGKRGEIDWTAPPADDNDSHEWGKRADNARLMGECPSCMVKRTFKRIAEAIWPPALGKPESIGPGPAKRTTIDPSKNQPCVYAPGADGLTDNVPGGCKPDSWAGPGKRDDTDGHHQTHSPDSHDWLKKRSAASESAESGPFLQRFSNTPFQKSQPFILPIGKNLAVNKRGFIESWMHPHAMEKRQRVCRDPGYALCPGTPGCCQSSDLCCPTAVCKTNPTEVCCPGYTCPQGYQCDRLCGGCVLSGGGCCPDGRRTCGPGQGCCPDGCFSSSSTCCRTTGGACPSGQQCCGDGCAPADNVCCGSGGSCGKGNICVIWQGKQTCCTDLRCTAWISDGVRVPLVATQTVEVPTKAPSPPPTTAPLAPPQETVEVVYSTYYWTITWWYYFYYYTYYAVLDVSTVTSSATTIYTTITITDTAAEAASAKFEAMSGSIVEEFTTPVEATTALATPTLPKSTSVEAPMETPAPPAQETPDETTAERTSSSDAAEKTVTETPASETPIPLPTQVTTSSRPSRTTAPPQVPTGGGAGMVEVNRLLGWGMGGVAAVAGAEMVWL